MEDKLRQIFGKRVGINTFMKGGKIEIKYYTDDDLGMILEKFGIRAV